MTITAPYGFVPLSQTVVFPSWLRCFDSTPPPLHDVPFEDGLCGTLELEIEAETPIFTRGIEPGGEQPFRLAGGAYAFPGTALRGALRNLVEIVTFSRFDRVNAHRYAVRDLNNRHLYGQHMAEIVKNPKTGKGEPMPLVNAGWLHRERLAEDQWEYEIEVCDFAKIEYRPLMQLARQRGVQSFQPGNKQSSVDKYRRWGQASREVEVAVDWRRPEKAGLLSRYGLATPAAGGTKGVLVFTGQPSRWQPDTTGRRSGSGNAKHHDFVFLPRASGQRLEVSPQQFEDFEFAHSDRGQQNRLGRSQTPNAEWGHWSNQDEPVPVFFLTEQGGRALRAFGLAMMFRLSYRFNIKEAIGHVSPSHVEAPTGLDFAEGLFGTVRDRLALKGRVGISHAVATGKTQPGPPVQVILGAPKASYYPNYVEQDRNHPGSEPGRDGTYLTWMDPEGVPRGWKRYRALTGVWKPPVPSGADGKPVDLGKVGTRFHPLPAGTRFRAHVDVHNLRPEELGALLWVLDFGGDPAARHTLGLARPLGYGRSRMTIASREVRDMAGGPADLDACRARFEKYMEQQVPGWKTSPQLRELLALARPVSPEAARYQRLDPGQRINEFVDAKKLGLALPSAAGLGRSSALARPGAGGPPPSSGDLRTGQQVQAVVLAETTRKGDPRFQVAGGQSQGILHPTSARPPSGFTPGETHGFIIMATGSLLQLKWVDPSAPPPRGTGGQRQDRPRGGPGHRRH